MAPFRFPVRVYYEDTDLSGVVYHAAYLKFFERGRTEMLRELGIHHRELAEDGIGFAVRSMTIDFVGAARIDDLLSVETERLGSTGVRLSLRQTLLRGDELLTRADVLIVPIRIGGGVARLPRSVRERLATHS